MVWQKLHPTARRDVVFGEGVWIASNVTVIGPCRSGAHALAAAGAVVTGDLPAYEIVGGVPARSMGRVQARPADAGA